MLDFAKPYQDKINELKKEVFYKNIEKYKFYNNASYLNVNDTIIPNDEWVSICRVSKTKDDKIIAYFEAGLSQPEFFVKQLEIFSLIDHPSSLIIKDLLNFMDLLFYDYKINKIKWSVIEGNPAKKIYDKFIETYNGRVVGIFYNDVLLTDRKLYNVVWYEIKREDYMKNKKK